jgi:hypothetical protein
VSQSRLGGSGWGVGDASGRGSTTSDATTSTDHSTSYGTGLLDEDCIFAGASGSSPNVASMDMR